MTSQEQDMRQRMDVQNMRSRIEASAPKRRSAPPTGFTWPKAFAVAAIWGAVVGVAIIGGGFYGAMTDIFALLATREIA